MAKKNIPARLWNFELKHEAKTMQFITLGLVGKSGYEEITGNMQDISE